MGGNKKIKLITYYKNNKAKCMLMKNYPRQIRIPWRSAWCYTNFHAPSKDVLVFMWVWLPCNLVRGFIVIREVEIYKHFIKKKKNRTKTMLDTLSKCIEITATVADDTHLCFTEEWLSRERETDRQLNWWNQSASLCTDASCETPFCWLIPTPTTTNRSSSYFVIFCMQHWSTILSLKYRFLCLL